MKDYDINVKGSCKVELFGTGDDTIVVPSSVKLDSDRNKADIEIRDVKTAKIGIPEGSEKIELACKDSDVSVKDLVFEQLEIDGKGNISVEVVNIVGSLEINMVNGQAQLKVPEGFRFRYELKGRNNCINCTLPCDDQAETVVEFNGSNSVLNITN